MGSIKTKRIYLPAEKVDGFRILVDRLWPRGVSKETAKLDIWLKEIAPSTDLRKWYHSTEGAEKWEEFRERYIAELKNNPVIAELRIIIGRDENVTLLYSVNDEQHNHATILKDFLEK